MKARASSAAAAPRHNQMLLRYSTRAPRSAGYQPHTWHCPGSPCRGGRSSGVGQTAWQRSEVREGGLDE